MTDKDFHSCMESDGQSKEENETKEVDETRPRYLYVSDGLVICCLDLQQNKRQPCVYKDADSVPSLPKVSILRMLDTGNPISAGLLKVDSDVYIVGGQVLSPGCANASDPRVQGCRYPWGRHLYEHLLWDLGLKGSSRSIHRLSKNGGTFSLSGPCGLELKEPKVWPIVEKVNGQIHVMSSLPFSFPGCYTKQTFTHEFFDLRAKGWTKVTTDSVDLGIGENISSKLVVVGNYIYAASSKSVLIYDSEAKNWKARRISKDFYPFFLKHVWHFLPYGHGRCVGEFGFLHGVSSEPLFVVIAIIRDIAEAWDFLPHVVAYLVDSTGRVLCFQRLDGFFQGYPKPYVFRVATVINVEELGNTMCTIVDGKAFGDENEDDGDGVNYDYRRLLFINIFTVEGLPNACSKVGEIWQQMNKYSCAVEMEFVRVIIKDSYVYKMDKECEGSDLPEFSCLQAVFP